MNKILIPIILAVIIISAILICGLTSHHNRQEIVIHISQGTSAGKIATLLSENDIIVSKPLFQLYIRIMGIDKKLSYGEFHFPANISMLEVIEKLERGKVKLHKVTIIEGLTIRQTAQILADENLVDYDKFFALCKDSTFAREVTGLPVKSLEGFLCPDTHFFPRQVSEEYVARTLVNEFFKQLASSLNTSDYDSFMINDIEYNLYDMLILASIIEKEATFNDEKPIISGVYHNRLKIGKRLQADPTVAYALKKEGIIRTIIYYRDLEINSPYNTYRNGGLPPAPICSPSITSVKAAINPEDTEYLFFFANNQRRHIFSRTYREHLDRQRQLRQNS